jgi:glycine cleavage system H protein
MGVSGHIDVAGYRLLLDRAYDPATHLWVQVLEPGRARVGMDPLAVETSGTLAQLAFLPVGSVLIRGEPFGSLEAAKFVGPLSCPLSGTILVQNEAVLTDPSLVEREPFAGGWLIELEPADPGGELPLLVEGEEQIVPWFAAEVEDYRLKGVLAE